MRVTIYVLDDASVEFEPVGDIRLVDGVAVPDPGLERFLEPTIVEPNTLRSLTPQDGANYLRALPAQYAHRSRVEAALYEDES